MANTEVDQYVDSATMWPAELQRLRAILADTPLVEDFKWRQPCYSHDGGNVLILGEFKDGCRVTFFKGALLDDPDDLLDPPGPNSRAGRILRYTDVDDIDEAVFRRFVDQAIANEEAGLSVEADPDDAPELPEELVTAFADVDGLQEAWEALTPGRQRGYVLHFADAKRSETRASRIEKHTPRIFEGKGLHDR